MGPFLICRVSEVSGRKKKKKKEKHTDELPLHFQQREDSSVSRQVGPEGSAQEALQATELFQLSAHITG